MRINQFIAQAAGVSRRKADDLIAAGKILVNGQNASFGMNVSEKDAIALDGKRIALQPITTVIFNKPEGYVCSRQKQDDPIIYELLPESMQHLKYAGRLDKESSGLVILTNDGQLLYNLTHPSQKEIKKYYVELQSPLKATDVNNIKKGIALNDGISALQISATDTTDRHWEITMKEGRNRQIRRTFGALGYTITKLTRLSHGRYSLDDLAPGKYKEI